MHLGYLLKRYVVKVYNLQKKIVHNLQTVNLSKTKMFMLDQDSVFHWTAEQAYNIPMR